VFGILREKNPELTGERRRTVLKPPQVAREGTKKTVFTNFMDLCKVGGVGGAVGLGLMGLVVGRGVGGWLDSSCWFGPQSSCSAALTPRSTGTSQQQQSATHSTLR